MKKKTRNTNKSKSSLSENEFGVILEEMNSKIDLILEGHAGLDRKIDKKIDDLREEMNFRFQEVNLRFDGIDKMLDGIDERLDGIDSNFKTVFKFLSQIDNELKQIKSELKNKADLTFLKTLEKRIKKLEINYTELHSLILQRCN